MTHDSKPFWMPQLVMIALRVAEDVLPIFEAERPNDLRPRNALETAKAAIEGRGRFYDIAWAEADGAGERVPRLPGDIRAPASWAAGAAAKAAQAVWQVGTKPGKKQCYYASVDARFAIRDAMKASPCQNELHKTWAKSVFADLERAEIALPKKADDSKQACPVCGSEDAIREVRYVRLSPIFTWKCEVCESMFSGPENPDYVLVPVNIDIGRAAQEARLIRIERKLDELLGRQA